MTYTLSLLTAASRDLVVEALRAEADKRTRVAQGAALALAPDRAARKDVRAASVRVTDLLAEAGTLDQLATELAAAQDVPLITGPDATRLVVEQPAHAVTLTGLEEHAVEAAASTEGLLDPIDTALVEELGDDGLSDAAHAAMAEAEKFAEEHLDDPDGPDVDTLAIREDEVGPVADPDDLERIAAADGAIIDEALS